MPVRDHECTVDPMNSDRIVRCRYGQLGLDRPFVISGMVAGSILKSAGGSLDPSRTDSRGLSVCRFAREFR